VRELLRSGAGRGLWFPGLAWPGLVGTFTENLRRVGLGLLEPPTELEPLVPPIFLGFEALTARLGLKFRCPKGLFMPVGVRTPEALAAVEVGPVTAKFLANRSVDVLFESSARAATAESSTAGTAFSISCGLRLWWCVA
jgi:hypothetical protein